MRAHPKVVPSPGRAVSHVLQKHDSSGAGRHTCSVDPKVPPVCVVVVGGCGGGTGRQVISETRG